MIVLNYAQYPTCSRQSYSILWQLSWSFCLRATSSTFLYWNASYFPPTSRPDWIPSEANRKNALCTYVTMCNEAVMHLLCKRSAQNTCYLDCTIYQLDIKGALKKAMFLTRIHHSAGAWHLILLSSSWNSEAWSSSSDIKSPQGYKEMAFRSYGLQEGLK